MPRSAPFASEPAEIGYQAAKKAGARITRDQFRAALRAFVTAQDASKRAYEKFRERRAEEDVCADPPEPYQE